MASRPRATRPHGHHRDENQPQTEATARNTGKRISPGRVGLNMCPVKGLGLRAARRPGRGLGAASSPRGPRPGAPVPATCSCTRFIYYRGQPTRISSKRPRRSRIQRCHVRAPDADRPPVVLLEGLPLEGDKQSPSTGQGPFFYIGGTNGASIISSYCESKGWQRTQDNRREDYKLKWCEIKCKESYINFREGQQLLFQLPNNKLLTTKIGLLSALREHARIVNKSIKTPPGTQAKILKMDEFFPETYRLDIREERQVFFTLFDVHAEEEPPVRDAQGRHRVEHGPPQLLHQRQVQKDQRPPQRLGLHHLHGPSTAMPAPALGMGVRGQGRGHSGQEP
uniref:Protein polyglycylase TTLL10 n=1 Tax=Castor canadensis TaxID=51338 RepID=A0A8C0WHM7_CASCN